jgi:hypothetical protein
MSLWDEAGELDKISNQISCLGNVLELVAEKLTENAESSTLWLCKDVCVNISERLDKSMVALLNMDMDNKKHERK